MRNHGIAGRGWVWRAAACAVMVVGVGGVGGVGGCSLRRPVDVGLAVPAEAWATRTAVDIHNYHGSVTVIVDPKLEAAETSAVVGASPPLDEAADYKATESVSIVSDWVEQEGGRVLRIRTGSAWFDQEAVWVDLTIRMPSCAGATVWNRGGFVELVGVEGAIQVDNGAMGKSPGTIRVRTARAMTAPVALTTDVGSVVYQVGANSTGAFELESGSGKAVFNSPAAVPARITVDSHNRTTATLNGGKNPVILRSGKGMVRAYVMEDPEAYTNKWE